MIKKYKNNIRLINGDCLEKMKYIDDGFIDLTVTSPPYDNLRTYTGKLKWNETIWKAVIKDLFRITKKGGVVVWVVGDATIKGSETGTSFKQALWAIACGFNLHDTMIYSCNKPPLTHNRYEQTFEYMFIWSKGKPKTFNPILKPNKYAGDNCLRNGNWMSGKDKSAMRQRNGKKAVKPYGIKGNTWRYETGGNKTTKDKIAFQHPAIFPEQLAHDHIISWSNEGDMVLDPFMGSGTTGKMVQILNRNFIGIEDVDEYFKIARQRIYNQ